MSSTQRKGFFSSNEASLLSVGDIVASINADVRNGLSCEEARRRLTLFGPNEFTISNDEPLWQKYLGQFKDPMIILLLVSALISVMMGQVDDALSITTAIVIVVTVAFVQVILL
jgi:Ca2+-transporting ATPase